MKPVQMIDSKLRGYTSYIVETIRFDNNVCLCVNVKWVDASIEQYDGGILQDRTHLLLFIIKFLYKYLPSELINPSQVFVYMFGIYSY